MQNIFAARRPEHLASGWKDCDRAASAGRGGARGLGDEPVFAYGRTMSGNETGGMNPLILAPVILAVLFTALLGCLVLGRRLGRRDAARGTDLSGLGAIDGAVFGLLGLLIAFSFSGAATRFDKRRTQIVEEANAIRTAYYRIDVLPPASQPALRESFRRYVDARLAIYRAIPDEAAVHQATERATAIWDEIWKQALTAGQASPGGRPDPFVLSALNAMFDITTARALASQTHPPTLIYFMLLGLALVAAVLAGYGMSATAARSSRLHPVAFALVLTATVYVILDLEYPRVGLIRLDTADLLLVDVRGSIR